MRNVSTFPKITHSLQVDSSLNSPKQKAKVLHVKLFDVQLLYNTPHCNEELNTISSNEDIFSIDVYANGNHSI